MYTLQEFCKEAKLSTTTQSSKEPTVLMHKGNRVSLIDCELTEISVDTVPTEKFALVSISAQPVSAACMVREKSTINYLCSFFFIRSGVQQK